MPPSTRRLFRGHDPEALSLTTAGGLIIPRLLEEGERADLQWLCRQLPAAELRSWLEGRGSRQLSRRSHAFWSLILAPRGVPTPSEPSAAQPPQDSLWPL